MGRNSIRAQEIRSSTFGRTMRRPIVESVETKLNLCDKAMDTIEARHDERVNSFSTTPISGKADCFRLAITRVDGQ